MRHDVPTCSLTINCSLIFQGLMLAAVPRMPILSSRWHWLPWLLVKWGEMRNWPSKMGVHGKAQRVFLLLRPTKRDPNRKWKSCGGSAMHKWLTLPSLSHNASKTSLSLSCSPFSLSTSFYQVSTRHTVVICSQLVYGTLGIN
jgi:hypothetical protein